MTIEQFASDSEWSPAASLSKAKPGDISDQRAAFDNSDPLCIPDILQIAIRRWRLLGIASLAGCLFGIAAFVFQPPSYRARTSIEIQNLNSDFLNVRNTSQINDDVHGDLAVLNLQTEIELLESSKVLQETKNSLKQDWLNKFVKTNGLSPYPDTLLDSIADSLSAQSVKSKVNAQQIKDTRIIELQVDAPNPLLAANFANTLVIEYMHQTVEQRRQATEAAEASTRLQLAAMREKLEISDRKLQSYANSHQLVFAPERQVISDDRIQQLQDDLSQARAEVVRQQTQRQLIASAGRSLPPAVEDEELKALRTKLETLQRQESSLRTIFQENAVEVKKVRAQEQELQSEIESQRKRIIAGIASQYQEAVEKEKLLTKAYEDAVAQTTQESKTAVQYDLLKQEVDANLLSYEKMLARGRDLAVAAALQTSNIRVLDSAVPPARQNAPKLPINAEVGLFTGFTLALGFIVIRDRTDEKLRRPGEAFERLGVPELATIHSEPNRLENNAPSIGYLMPPVTVENGLALFPRNSVDDYPATSDSFRSLAASVLLSTVNGKRPRSLVVASCFEGEGKTTIASHLAVALARAGKRVLLIDGDLRNPQVHARFSLSNGAGMGDLLEARLEMSEAKDILLSTKLQRLKILAAGSCRSKTPDLLFNPHVGDLLQSLTEKFDLILIDTPPLLCRPDGRLIARYADGVVLVTRANHTTRKAIATVCDRLALDGRTVLGVVLNDWSGTEMLVS